MKCWGQDSCNAGLTAVSDHRTLYKIYDTSEWRMQLAPVSLSLHSVHALTPRFFKLGADQTRRIQDVVSATRNWSLAGDLLIIHSGNLHGGCHQ